MHLIVPVFPPDFFHQTDLSITDITIPQVSSDQFSNICPISVVSIIDLNTALTNTIPTGTEVIWSTDNDPSDGISPNISNFVYDSGTYYAYFRSINGNCYSTASENGVVVSINDCCSINSDLTITTNTIFDTPMAYGGDVIVENGATLTITSEIQFDEDKQLIIEDGGTVNLIDNGTLRSCDYGPNWEGVFVKYGGSFNVNLGYIYSANNAVVANAGSNIDIYQIIILGNPNGTLGTGISLYGAVNVGRLKKLKIRDYHQGIECMKSNSYYHIVSGEISNCRYGIKLSGAPARISDFNIIASGYGIYVFHSPGTLIENNYLNKENNSSSAKGITLWSSDGSLIRNNTIGSNDTYEPHYGITLWISNNGSIEYNTIYAERTGILLFKTNFSVTENDITLNNTTPTNNSAISLRYGNNAQIKNNYINSQNLVLGISSSFSASTNIENNNIQGSFDNSSYRPAGISSKGCNNEIIANNYITSNGVTSSILATNTAGNTYDCNYTNSHTDALSILFNSQGQSVKGNFLSGWNNDLIVRSEIGLQDHGGNEFNGGYAVVDNSIIALGSRFNVNSMFNDHMPDNININDWFEDEPNVQTHYECAGPPGPDWIPFWDNDQELCSYYQSVINDHGYSSIEYLRMIQTMLRYGSQRSGFQLPACILNDSIMPSSWKTLVGAELKLRIGHEYGLSNISVALYTKLDSLSYFYEIGNGDIYFNNNKDLIFSLSDSLQGTEQAYLDSLSVIKSDLDNITYTDSIMDVALPIMKEYINFLTSTDKSGFDYNFLINKSRLCSDYYGPYIHLAREIVYTIIDENFDQYDDCMSANVRSRSFKNEGVTNTSIYPSPSNGRFIINFGKSVAGKVKVLDISGRVIFEADVDDRERLGIDISHSIGLHLIRIHHLDGYQEVLKHIVTK